MMWVLLQLESPWQRNDAITFFIYLCVSLYQEFFLRNRLGEFVHAIVASIMAKFEQILGERFRRLRVVPHFSSRIVGRAKRERA